MSLLVDYTVIGSDVNTDKGFRTSKGFLLELPVVCSQVDPHALLIQISWPPTPHLLPTAARSRQLEADLRSLGARVEAVASSAAHCSKGPPYGPTGRGSTRVDSRVDSGRLG